MQCHAALLASRTRRPGADLAQPPKRASASTPSGMRCGWSTRPAATRTATCVAVKARIVGDTGAYASVGDKVLERAAGHACGAYAVAERRRRGEARSTRTTRPAARCAASASTRRTSRSRALLDLLAEQVGIDGWEIRWRNALEEGDRFGTGQRLGPGVGLKQTLLAVRDAYRDARYAGIACAVKNTGIGNGLVENGPRRAPAGGGRDGHALPFLDGDGPGRPHRPPPDRLRGARPAPGAIQVAVDTESRPRDRADDRLAVDRARRERRRSTRRGS